MLNKLGLYSALLFAFSAGLLFAQAASPAIDPQVRDAGTVLFLFSDTRVLREVHANVARRDMRVAKIMVEPAAGPERVAYRVHLAPKTPPPLGLHGGASFTIVVNAGALPRQQIVEVSTTTYEKGLPTPSGKTSPED